MNDMTPPALPEENPPTIEYGNLIWTKAVRAEGGVEYESNIPGRGDVYIYQYPSGGFKGSSCLRARFDLVTPAAEKLTHLGLQSSGITADRREAMLNCMDAFCHWVDEMRTTLARIEPDNDYAVGFRAGQEDIKSKVAEVVL